MGTLSRILKGDFQEFIWGFLPKIPPRIFSRNSFEDCLREFIRRFPLWGFALGITPDIFFPRIALGISSRNSCEDCVQKFFRTFLQELLRGFPPEAPPGISSRHSSRNCAGKFFILTKKKLQLMNSWIGPLLDWKSLLQIKLSVEVDGPLFNPPVLIVTF